MTELDKTIAAIQADQRGQFYDKLPPATPTLGELIVRAWNARNAFTQYQGRDRSHDERNGWSQLNVADIDARRALIAGLVEIGLTDENVRQLGELL